MYEMVATVGYGLIPSLLAPNAYHVVPQLP